MSSVPSCCGRHRDPRERKWFTPKGKSTEECTYCEECFTNNIKGTPQESDYYMTVLHGGCNCDYPKDYTATSIEKNGLRVQVTNTHGTAFPKLKDEMANLNGVMHVCVPTCNEYHVEINNLTASDKYSYMTFENGKVGDKAITINNGTCIYYSTDLIIKGFRTGTNESFMFKSLSDREKTEGKTLEGENSTNIISIKIQKWKETPAAPKYFFESHSHSYAIPCSGTYDDCESLDTLGTTRTRGGPMPKGAKGGFARGINSSSSSSSQLSGGATLSGGSQVDHVRTTTTDSTFTRVGEPVEFLIQLVCNQSDDEKYAANRAYDLKKRHEKREQLISKKREHQRRIDTLKMEQEREQSHIEKLDEQLEQFKDLGSYVKEDYLVPFKQ
jgi:hypothetical protein